MALQWFDIKYTEYVKRKICHSPIPEQYSFVYLKQEIKH